MPPSSTAAVYSIHDARTLMATFVEEAPLEDVEPTQRALHGWSIGTSVAAHVDLHRRIKLVLSHRVHEAPERPLTFIVYVPPESRIGKERHSAADFILLDNHAPPTARRGRPSNVVPPRDWWSWDQTEFAKVLEAQLCRSTLSVTPPLQRSQTLLLSATQQLYVAAFARWAANHVRQKQMQLAAAVANHFFSFEYSVALEPRILADPDVNLLFVDESSVDGATKIHFELRIFDPSTAAAGSDSFSSLCREAVELVFLSTLPPAWTVPRGTDDSVSASWLDCVICFSFTCTHADPRKTPICSPFTLHCQRSESCPSSFEGAVDDLAGYLERAVAAAPPEVMRPSSSHATTLVDALPALETIVVRSFVIPLLRWLRLVEAFRAVFGPSINDTCIGSITDAGVAQFITVDDLSLDAVIVTLKRPSSAELPVVTYTSAQQTLRDGGGVITFKWVDTTSTGLHVDNPCGIAAAVFEYLSQNLSKLRRVCASQTPT